MDIWQFHNNPLSAQDKEIFDLIVKELDRQENSIELIASENIVSAAVRQAMGSILTNKYAEGYPGARYYGGCEIVDEIENLCIERAKQLFHCKFANVQPHSGSQANAAMYQALCEPGDTILSLSLNDGGHLTHGSPVSFSGKTYNFIHYRVNPETGYIDMYDVEAKAKQYHPKLILAGASAYPRAIDFAEFRGIAKEVGSYFAVDMAHIAGLVAAGEHESPIPYADVITTTTHKTLRGPRGGMILCNNEDIAKKINKAVFPCIQGGPLEHIIAGKAVALKEAMTEDFKEYQRNVIRNAKAFEKTFHQNGVKMVTNGTDNHLLLLDLSNYDITGAQLEHDLLDFSIVVNKNMVPNDKRKPKETSGIRLGTPAITTRGVNEYCCGEIANIIADVIYKRTENYKYDREMIYNIIHNIMKF